MPIQFVPERGHILICNFDMAGVDPEMAKVRRVVVLSPRSYNDRHAGGPGRCIVVPFSGTAPYERRAAHVAFPHDGRYRSFGIDLWAICDCLAHVSHRRLDRVQHRGTNLSERLTAVDLQRVELGVRYALGLLAEP